MKPKGGSRILTWANLQGPQIQRYERTSTVDEKHRILSELFNLGDDKRSLIVRDLFFYTLQFAKEQKYSTEQTSTFFSIVKAVHETCISTHLDNLESTFSFFKELVLRHSVQRPPFSVGLFSPEQARKMTNYVTETYFRHFRMYKYAFTPHVTLDLTLEYDDRVDGPEEGDVEAAKDEPAEGATDVEDGGAEGASEGTEAHAEQELTSAEKELKAIITAAVKEQLKELQGNVDQQMKQLEDVVSQQFASLGIAETSKQAGRKSSRAVKKK